jgi:hypothetical protein
MSNRHAGVLAHLVERRTPILEPILVVASVSLLTSWAIQPYVVHALAQQGAVAQGAAQAALWLSGVLSPFAAFAKAAVAALVCWSCAIYLGERLSLLKLISIFCLAEMVFSLRDLSMWIVLALRGVERVHSTADLMVAFGLNAYLRSPSALARVAFESWDVFTVAWALVICWMIRGFFKIDLRSSAFLAAMAFSVRTLFAAASLLYGI